MKQNNCKGAITVFLSIIFMIIFILVGVLIDGARVRAGEAQVRRALESSMKSTLAGYSNQLKENYGLFALNNNNQEVIEEELQEYLNKNLCTELGADKKDLGSELYGKLKSSITGGDEYKDVAFLNLYDYRIEDIKVTPIFNLSENQVTENQIVEYMKYRAPKELVDSFIEKLSKVKEVSKTSDACEKKMELDEVYADLQNLQKKLMDKVNEIEEHQSIDEFNELVPSYISNVDSYITQRVLVDSLEAQDKTSDDYKELRERLIDKQRSFSMIMDKLYDWKDLNTDALDLSNKMKLMMPELKKKIQESENYLFNNSDINSEFKAAYEQDIKDIKKSINSDNFEQIQSKFSTNKQISSITSAKLKSFDSRISTESEETNEIVNEIANDFNNKIIVNIGYNFKVNTTTETDPDDPRDDAKKNGNKALAVDETKEVKTIEEKILKLLPSLKNGESYPNKIISQSFETEDSKKNANGLGFEGSEKGQIDFKNKDYTKDSFCSVKDIGSAINDNLEDLRNNLYINEYILGTFKNTVLELKDDSGKTINFPYNLRVKEKKSLKTFFNDGEVEYILHGSKSEKTNVLCVKGQILLFRFVADTISGYSDTKKNETASAIATASSWWSLGLSAPLVHTLVMCGFGMADAVLDLNQIMDGKYVDILKVNKVSDKAKSESNLLKFSYHDYLRLFLLLQNNETKMNRIEDLIQINMQETNPDFKISDYNTYLRVEATVSIKYMFMTQALMPDKYKMPDGTRHKINIAMYNGY